MSDIHRAVDALIENGVAVVPNPRLWAESIKIAEEFYQLTIEERIACHTSLSLAARGYSLSESEFERLRNDGIDLSFARDVDWVGAQRRRGYSSFDIGRTSPTSPTSDLVKFLFAPNVMPASSSLVGAISSLYEDFADFSSGLSDVLLKRLEHGDPPVDWNASYTSLRLLEYPEGASGWSKSHTDYEFLAVIAADSAGLQVRSSSGDWVAVDADHGELVILAGDCLQSLSAGRVRAAEHRVELGFKRLSVPFFQGLPLNFPLHALGMTFGEHVAGRLVRSFPHLRIAHDAGILLPQLDVPETNPFHGGAGRNP